MKVCLHQWWRHYKPFAICVAMDASSSIAEEHHRGKVSSYQLPSSSHSLCEGKVGPSLLSFAEGLLNSNLNRSKAMVELLLIVREVSMAERMLERAQSPIHIRICRVSVNIERSALSASRAKSFLTPRTPPHCPVVCQASKRTGEGRNEAIRGHDCLPVEPPPLLVPQVHSSLIL